MLRKLLFPIAAGLLVGKGVSLYRDRQFQRNHPLKSLFRDRRSCDRRAS